MKNPLAAFSFALPADLTRFCDALRLYMSSDQFVYNPYYLVQRSPIQSTLGDARLRDSPLTFYMKNGRVSPHGPGSEFGFGSGFG